MTAVYREVLADLDRRIARLQGTRDSVAAVAELDDNAVDGRRGRGPAKTGRAKVGGGDQVVLEVIRGGANTLPKIVAEAKVKSNVAKAAVRRLRASGRVQMHGTRRSATYEVKKGR